MEQAKAQSIVSGCVLGVLVLGMADDYLVKDEKPPFKFYVAVAVTGAALAYISDVNPEAAAWLAIIIFIVVLMEEGAPVLKAIQESKTIGQITEPGSSHISEFPAIPFTKEKGKKKPTIIKKVSPLPIKRTVPVVKPAIKLNPEQHLEHGSNPLKGAEKAVKEFFEKVKIPSPGTPPPIQDWLPDLIG